MAALHLHTRSDSLARSQDEALIEAGGVLCQEEADGPRHRLLDEVVDEAWATGPARSRPARLGLAGETLVMALLLSDEEGPLAGVADLPGLRRSLQSFFHAAGIGGISAALFARLTERLGGRPGDGRTGARLGDLAALYGRYRAVLGTRLADEGMAWRRGAAQLAHRAAEPGAPRDITVYGLDRCPDAGVPTGHGRLLALAALAGRDPDAFARQKAPGPEAPVQVRVVLPAVEGRPLLEAALAPTLEALYRYHELNLEEVRVPLGPATGDAYAGFVRGLFLPGSAAAPLQPGELPEDRLGLLAAPSPAAEARAVAQRLRDRIDAGVDPGSLLVVAQSAAGRARLRGALSRYGVPVYEPRPLLPPAGGGEGTLLATPPLQVVLGLYGLLDRGVPREAFIQHLSSGYLHFEAGGLPPWRVARALREAGVRDLLPPRPGPGHEPDFRRRLHEWGRQQLAASRERSAESLRLLDGGVAAAVEQALSILSWLPELAPPAAHAAALLRLCERLRLGDGPRGGDLAALTDPALRLGAQDDAACARDAEAVAALLGLLEEWPRAARRIGPQVDRISRSRFVGMLVDALGRSRGRPGAGPGGAVVLGDLVTLCGRPASCLFLTGLTDGDLPSRGSEDPFLSEDDRRGLNRLLGHEVFPLFGGPEAQQPLWFALALSQAGAAHCSWPVSDDDGRPMLRSPYVDEVLRAAGRPEPPRGRHAVIPAADEARCPAELWSRAALDRRGNADPVLLRALAAQDPERAAHLSAVIGIEESRLRWFARLAVCGAEAVVPDALAGPFDGRLRDPLLRQQIQSKLPGSHNRPLSASALEDYAKCPFRFFLRRVLKAEPPQEGSDDLDPLAGGRLHHEVLEKFFLERKEAGRLPLSGDADDLGALDRIIDDVLLRWPQRERVGHRELFGVRVRRLREDLRHLVVREAQRPVAPGCVPALFEHQFGPLSISSPSDLGGGMPLHIFGIIDRVDIGGEHAVVLDYKAGRLDRYEHILQHDLLSTSFQLPLYAAALKADPKLADAGISIAEVTARYYSLRSGRASAHELNDQEMISLSPEVQKSAPERNVAEVAYRLWRRLRDGDFRVAPKTCEGCGLESACRITLVEPDPEDETVPGRQTAEDAA